MDFEKQFVFRTFSLIWRLPSPTRALHAREIILRSAVQHSLKHFLTDSFAKTRITATTTLIAAVTHLP